MKFRQVFVITAVIAIYLPAQANAAYVGPDCNEKDVVGYSPLTSKVAFMSNDGSAALDNFTLYTVNSDGNGDLKRIGSVVLGSPTIISPDGTKVLFSSEVNGAKQIFISDIEGNNPIQLTHGMGPVSAIAFFPNSTRLIFGQDLKYKTGFSSIYSINSDGTGLFQITHDPQEKFWTAVSANGKVMVYNGNSTGIEDPGIYAINTDGTGLHLVTSGSLFTHRQPITDNGTKIILTRYKSGSYPYQFIYSINTDGSGFEVIGNNVSYSGDYITTHNGSVTYYWQVLRSNGTTIVYPERINGTMQIFFSKDNGQHTIPLVNNSYFTPNPNCKLPCDLPGGCGRDTDSGPAPNSRQIAYTENHQNPETSNAIILALVTTPIAAGISIGVFLFTRKPK